jgi:lipoprotein-releasing system permease protein
MLRGVEPDEIGEVSDLRQNLTEGELAYLDDPRPLVEEVERRRKRERRKFLRDLDTQRDQLDIELGPDRGAGGPAGPQGGFEELDEPPEGIEFDGELGGADDPTVGSEGFMPPIGAGGSSEDASAGGDAPPADDTPEMMPPIGDTGADDAPGDTEQGSTEGAMMPSIEGGEAADEELFSEIEFEEEDGDEAVEEEGATGEIPGIIIGVELAKSLSVQLGDELNVVTPRGDIGPTGPIPRSRPFRVVGIFKSGMYEYDSKYGYTHLDDARDFLNIEGASGVELKTVHIERAVPIAQQLQERFGDRVEVLDWVEMNHSLFYALKLEKIAMFVVLTFIILVASFSIVAMLIMIVIEKGSEIAVMKSLGMSNAGVMRTFIFQGTVIGTVGTTIGLGLGLLICYLLEEVGFPLDSEVYYISTLPVDVNPLEVLLVVVCAIGISMLATIYPARQASRLDPVEGLRYGYE